MSKGKIITFSIISFIVLLNIILFGFVFRLRKQEVLLNDVTINSESIIKSAGLKNGKSIFLVDKDSAISNVEKAYPNIKVVQIKTIGVTKLQFIVRTRYPLYYSSVNDKFYILDEELKVLEIETTEPNNLIKIETELDLNNAEVGNFVGTDKEKEISYKFFKAMYEAVIKTSGLQARQDISAKVNSMKLENNRLIIETLEGVKLDIENPSKDLTRKINIGFTKINSLITEGKSSELANSTIKIFYNSQEDEFCRYIKAE